MTSMPRRALLSGAMAVAATAGLSTARADGAPQGRPCDAVEGLLRLFATTPVVALNEGAHHLQDCWDFLAAVMFHPGFREVGAIVIELGNSRHQNVADDFVNGGIVRKSTLQKIWRDTTQSPFATGDIPVIFRLLSLARTINLHTRRANPLRVLLADPPIDWTQIRNRDDHGRLLSQRDDSWTEVITREVLARQQRCLTIGGGLHFFRNLPFLGTVPPGTPLPSHKNVSALIEQKHPGSVSVVHTHAIVARDKIAQVEHHLNGWARPSIAATARTSYGTVAAADIMSDLPPEIRQRFGSLTVADLADHVLFLGRRSELTAAVTDWEVFYEPTYWAELNRRKALIEFPRDLDQLRQEENPAMF
ncbi:hypothetical protein JOF56_010914 [Kibdelosporangium banguiense]|uniref:Erythromycin esterase n=1 Tax=Kibdelosporangium banguiense TaxID=1365924 RepID=A0ABS4U1J6_9PSEU|nr:hypothetical protein [Kibdelosporangium banguiense]MBP2330529.1 hypothetical protein [Kibdelosporangium banguiense]